MFELLKLGGVLALIVLLLRLRWNLGGVLALASAVTGLLYRMPARDLALSALGGVVAVETLRLVAIVLLIAFMGEILRSTLQLEGLVRSLGGLFRDCRWLLAVIPLLIGLLPMVGGAMFSAPMVEEAGQGLRVSRERKTFVNYWFRHACETVLPIYPSLVVAASLMGLPVQTLATSNWPLLLASLAGGAFLGLLPIRNDGLGGRDCPRTQDTWLLLLKSIWPIALVLTLAMILHLDLILSLVLTVAALVGVHRLGPRPLWAIVRRMPLDVAVIIVGAMVFQRVLTDSGAVEAASRALAGLGIPVPLVVFSVPMMAALLTGMAVAAFAIGFPIVLPLCPPDLVGSGYAVLAYCGGFAGLLLSPVHLCLALTRAYFKASWGGVYRLVVPAAALLAVAAALAVLLR